MRHPAARLLAVVALATICRAQEAVPDEISTARGLMHKGLLRAAGLAFQRNTGALTITAPANGNVAPPGYYMLFILNTDSVPSVAKIVKVSQP
jgi:hypothetical protein